MSLKAWAERFTKERALRRGPAMSWLPKDTSSAGRAHWSDVSIYFCCQLVVFFAAQWCPFCGGAQRPSACRSLTHLCLQRALAECSSEGLRACPVSIFGHGRQSGLPIAPGALVSEHNSNVLADGRGGLEPGGPASASLEDQLSPGVRELGATKPCVFRAHGVTRFTA